MLKKKTQQFYLEILGIKKSEKPHVKIQDPDM